MVDVPVLGRPTKRMGVGKSRAAVIAVEGGTIGRVWSMDPIDDDDDNDNDGKSSLVATSPTTTVVVVVDPISK
jgi:hypothetical protein